LQNPTQIGIDGGEVSSGLSAPPLRAFLSSKAAEGISLELPYQMGIFNKGASEKIAFLSS
jgi:hypothetical protein